MTKKIFGRFLLLAGTILLLGLFSWEAFSEELSVVEVRRNIPLSDKDPVFKDYYLNAGAAQGLKQHLVVTVVRKVALKDATGTQNYGEVLVPVGQLKVILVGEKISVARLYKEISREDQPMLEQTGVMIGDKVDLKGSFVDNHKAPVKNDSESETVVTVVLPKPQAEPTPAPATKTPATAPTAKAVAVPDAPVVPPGRAASTTPSDDGAL